MLKRSCRNSNSKNSWSQTERTLVVLTGTNRQYGLKDIHHHALQIFRKSPVKGLIQYPESFPRLTSPCLTWARLLSFDFD